MNIKRISKTAVVLLAMLALAGMTAQRAHAVTYDLEAVEYASTAPDGSSIKLWGFKKVGDPVATSPGPVLEVPVGDTNLTVTLKNSLPAVAGMDAKNLEVSLVIPGLLATNYAPASAAYTSPNTNPGGDTLNFDKIYSFDHTAAPGATATYTYTNVQPGVYLYHSGVNPALQVPMGLFGAVTAYANGPTEPLTGVTLQGPSATSEVLVLSEIDPKLSEAVYGGTYGSGAISFENHPKWFFINGKAFSQDSTNVKWMRMGSEYMVHLVNAGVQQHAITLTQGNMVQYAEDNHLLKMPRRLNAINVGPAQVMAMKITPPPSYGRPFALYDRSLDAKNASPSTFGMVEGMGGIFMPMRTDFAADCGYDLNGDGVPNAADLNTIFGSGEWGRTDCAGLNGLLDPAWCAFDFNGDGSVTQADRNWLTSNDKLNGSCAAAPAPLYVKAATAGSSLLLMLDGQ